LFEWSHPLDQQLNLSTDAMLLYLQPVHVCVH